MLAGGGWCVCVVWCGWARVGLQFSPHWLVWLIDEDANSTLYLCKSGCGRRKRGEEQRSVSGEKAMKAKDKAKDKAGALNK